MPPRPRFDPIAEAQRQWTSRWPDAALAMTAATSIMRAQQIVLAAVDEVLRGFDLTFACYRPWCSSRFRGVARCRSARWGLA